MPAPMPATPPPPRLPASAVRPTVWLATTETLLEVTCAPTSMPAVVPLVMGAAVSTSALTCSCGTPPVCWLTVCDANWLSGVRLWLTPLPAAVRSILVPFSALPRLVASAIWPGVPGVAIT